jgi:hypothetical protein
MYLQASGGVVNSQGAWFFAIWLKQDGATLKK